MSNSDFWVVVTDGTLLLLLCAALVRRLNPWLARRSIGRLLNAAPPGTSGRHRTADRCIIFDSVGFRVAWCKDRSAQTTAMAWHEVERVTAFKRDLLTVDCICLLFTGEDGTGIELNEEMAGWEAVTDALPVHLPGCKPWLECFSEVAFPAFRSNLTEIYSRGGKHLA